MIADATARKPNKSWSASSTIQFKKRNVQTPTNRNTTINKQSFNSLPSLPKQTSNDRPFFRKPSSSAKLPSQPLENIQHLHQQNTSLKQKINTLNTALGKQRTKVQINSKNFKRLNQKMSTEFAQEIYFECLPNKNYLVEGVKCQYYMMKQKYEEKCRECEALMKKEGKGEMMELKVYCDAIQGQNRILKGRLEKLLKIEEELFGELQLQQHMEIATEGGVEATQQWKKEQQQNITSLLGISAKIATLEESKRNAARNMLRLQDKLEMQRKVLMQRKGKIDYLERLIKRLSNEIHELQLSSFRENKKLTEAIEELCDKIKRDGVAHQMVLEEQKKKQMKKREDQKDIYTRHLKQKQGQIEQLQSEVKILKTMIKTLKRELPQSLKKHKRNTQQQRETQYQPIIHETDIDKFKFTFAKDSPNIWDEDSILSIDSNSKEVTQQIQNTRIPKSSFIKYAQSCIRVKPVKASQIQHLKKQMKTQLQNNQLSVDDIKHFFDFNPSNPSQDQQWKAKYISLQQIKQTLTSHLFGLHPHQALLLGRYMVQDCSKEEIYFHLDNQVKREVAKSIIRAFLGEYSLPDCRQK